MEFLLFLQLCLLAYIAAKLRGDIWEAAHRRVAWLKPKTQKKLKFFQADILVYPTKKVNVTDELTANGVCRKYEFPVIAGIGIDGVGTWIELDLCIMAHESFEKAMRGPLLEFGVVQHGEIHGTASITLNENIGRRVECELMEPSPMIFRVSGKTLEGKSGDLKQNAVQNLTILYEGSVSGPNYFFEQYLQARADFLGKGHEFAAIADEKILKISNQLHEKFKDEDGWSPYKIRADKLGDGLA